MRAAGGEEGVGEVEEGEEEGQGEEREWNDTVDYSVREAVR